jgi:polyhydroxybutyrate depolymerase
MSSKMQPADRHTIPLAHEGMGRPYELHVPPNADADRMPLVLELHGRDIDATQFDRMTGFGSLADEAGFVLALPNAVGEIWNDGRSESPKWTAKPDDVGYLAAVIDDAIARLPIDPPRIYVVVMSNGAVMAGRLACELADRIALAHIAGPL